MIENKDDDGNDGNDEREESIRKSGREKNDKRTGPP